MRPKPAADIAADPFAERRSRLLRAKYQLLGGGFEFATESAELMRLVEWAYAGLPRQRLSARPPRLAVRLAMIGGARSHRRIPWRTGEGRRAPEPAPFVMLSGSDLLCGAGPASSVAVICAARRAALVIVAQELLRFPYHVRYELIELAVFTLAARVQGLMPLHAACVGRAGRGVLLIGASGAGKSTAVLHCGLQGLELMSEDSLFVTPDRLLATGVANFLHVRRESLGFLSATEASFLRRSPTIRRRSGVEKFEVDLRQARFRLARGPLEICAVVELSARPARRGPLLTPLVPRAALGRLRASQPYAAGQPGWLTFARRLRTVPAFELRRGKHPRETVAELQRLLEHGRARRP